MSLAACSVNGAKASSFTVERNPDGRITERSRLDSKLVPGLRGGDRCKNKETLFAHVDNDKLRDRIYHDWIKGGPVLGVCTGDGRTDRRRGSGMTELLWILDVQQDDRDEILYGGTSISAKYYDVAVFRKGKIRRVLRRKESRLYSSGEPKSTLIAARPSAVVKVPVGPPESWLRLLVERQNHTTSGGLNHPFGSRML
jgi:hypothetical protein